MTPTTLAALRRLLFFTCAEAAQLIPNPPASEEQWQAWENGSQAIPEELTQKIRELVDWRETALAIMGDNIRQQIRDKGVPESIFILWYEQLDDWRALQGREPAMWRIQQSVCAALSGMFKTIRLVPFEATAYARWLGDREDSEPLRAEWASTTTL